MALARPMGHGRKGTVNRCCRGHLSHRLGSSDAAHAFIYDGWNVVLELVERDNVTDRIEYYWGKDISGSLHGAGGVGGLLYLKRNGAIYVPFYDAYGNVMEYRAADGVLVAAYVYDAFGRTISQTGPLADTFRFRHATRCFDAETGLYYHGYRFYSVIMRRWLTRDPSGENGGINLYVAMNNAAVCYYDPIGLRASFSINSAPQDNECIMSKGSKYPRAVTRRSGDISFSCDPDCRIVVSGKLKLWIEMLPEGNERWDTNYRRYKDSPIITERLNAYNHELDHFNTWSAFYQFLATANSYDGKRYANCDERVADLNARYSCFESETEKHSHQFDDKGKNMGGQYSRYPLDVSRFSWE